MPIRQLYWLILSYTVRRASDIDGNTADTNAPLQSRLVLEEGRNDQDTYDDTVRTVDGVAAACRARADADNTDGAAIKPNEAGDAAQVDTEQAEEGGRSSRVRLGDVVSVRVNIKAN